jgi:hypothetical protein
VEVTWEMDRPEDFKTSLESPIVPTDPDHRPSRPTISLFAVLALLFGTALGAFGLFLYLANNTEIGRPQNLARCSSHLSRIGTALEIYKKDHGDFPKSQYELVPDYLEQLPICPSAQRMTYRTSFGPELVPNTEVPDYFLVECCGHNHKGAQVAPNSPSLDSLTGLKVVQEW